MATKKATEKKPVEKSAAKKTKASETKVSETKAVPAKKPATQTVLFKGSPSGDQARALIAETMAKVNAAMGTHVVQRACDMDTSSLLRRPTGITGLDIGLGGGWPAGTANLITGPDGAGKDFLLNMTIAQLQKNYGNDCRVAIFSTEFPYDKQFARDICGVKVADTDQELDEIDEARAARGVPLLTAEERATRKQQIGDIYLIQGVTADKGLDAVLSFLDDGLCQVVAINSLGVFETEAKDGTDSLAEHAQQSSEAQLLSRFVPKMFASFNRPTPWGGRNQTTLIATNQVRAKRDMARGRPGMPTPEHAKYQGGAGAWALKHGKAIDLLLHKGSPILDKSEKPPVLLGREINWEIGKGKFGTHDGIRGHYEFYHGEGADLEADILAVGLKLEVIESSGSWYSYGGERMQGVNGLRSVLRKNPEMYSALVRDCHTAASIYCRYT